MQAKTINTAELKSNFTPLVSDQGNPGLLKVVDLCPQRNSRQVSGPRVALSQYILDLPRLRIHH